MENGKKQIFQTERDKRWKNFKLIIFLSALLLFMLSGVGIYSLIHKEVLLLPRQLGESALVKIALKDTSDNTAHNEFRKDIEAIRTEHQQDFYKIKTFAFGKNSPLNFKTILPVRAGFFVNWDIQSFQSLQKHIDKINMVLPEWFFVQDNSDSVYMDLSPTAQKALEIMKRHQVSIVPMVSNYFNQKWNGDNVHRIIHNKKKRKTFIASILQNVQKYHFQGVNIDFEELNENSDEDLITFMKELSEVLHKNGLILTQDVEPFNEDYNYKELAKSNDFIFLMAYDQHNTASVAGPVCGYKWVENALDEATRMIPSGKIVLCVAAYGYDWPKGFRGTDITYEEAIATAAESDTIPYFNKQSYNLNYRYWDDNNLQHDVYFADAATCFNIMRAGYDFGTSGTAIWRLGSEDERVWTFYNKDLSFDKLRRSGIDFKSLQLTPASRNVDYIGQGEILNIVSSPSTGLVSLAYDTSQNLISDQLYKSVPTGYVIKKTGVKEKKIVLSFDDGPDEVYTNQVMDILEKYNVPASFFVLGINIQANLPTFKKLFEKGYEIGNHTYTHTNLELASLDRTLLELRSTRRMIEAITGRSTILFRPPYTIDAEPTTYDELKPLAIGRDENYIYVGASIDTRDWEKNVSADTIFARATSQRNLGNIILLHDAGGSREETIKALPRIIDYYLKNGYTFTTISDLIDKSKSELMPALNDERASFINRANITAITLTYYCEIFLYYLFFAALFLTSFRLIIVAVLATKKRYAADSPGDDKSEKDPPLKVSVIVPAYNEEVNILKTVEHLLLLTYHHLEILIIDDGSKDNTYKNLLEQYGGHQKVKIYTKANGGKADALNYGILHCTGDLLFCIDADTFIEASAVEKMVSYFRAERVAAVAGNVKVGNTLNMLTNWQSIEYTTSQNFDRLAFDVLNAIMVVPGAIGMFDRKKVLAVGAFTTDTLAEDCDLTLRLLNAGYSVKTCSNAYAFTEAPEKLEEFMKQRKRWSFGIMQSFWKHRKLLFSFKKPNMGWVVLPNMLLFQMFLPVFNPLVDLTLIFSLVFGKTAVVLGLYLAYMIIDMLIAVIAYTYEGEKMKLKTFLYMVPQRIIYRQLYFVILVNSYLKILKGELQYWGILKRTGNIATKITAVD
jgi:cellulose synthase/poly-beta-1,6-N-acetylglucosamine synthase-like glycosyltransferase/spore germination protein YaaH/peptidoglycan/xylan/chitin deacetylase (PgdA/CDA1 family)